MHEQDYTREDAERGYQQNPEKATQGLTKRNERADALVETALKAVGRAYRDRYFAADGSFKRPKAARDIIKALGALAVVKQDELNNIEGVAKLLLTKAAGPLRALLKVYKHGRPVRDVRTVLAHSQNLRNWTRADCEAEERREAGSAGQPDEERKRTQYQQDVAKRRARNAALIEQVREKVEAEEKARAERKAHRKPRPART